MPWKRHRDDTGGDHDPWEYCVDDPVSRIDPEGLDDESWVDAAGRWFYNTVKSVKDWFNDSPQPNQKDAIVGTADAAAKMAEQAGNVASTLQKAGMTTADKAGDVLNSPGVKGAVKAVGAVAKGAKAIDAANNVANIAGAFRDLDTRDAEAVAIEKRMNWGTMTDQELREWENRDWWKAMKEGASAAGKAGASLQ